MVVNLLPVKYQQHYQVGQLRKLENVSEQTQPIREEYQVTDHLLAY